MSELDYARVMDADILDASAHPVTDLAVSGGQLAEIVDDEPAPLAIRSTGLAHQTVTTLEADPYIGVAAVPFDEKAQTVLSKYQEVPHEWIDIKPNGQIYLSHMRLRAIYNEAFGFGGWGLVPVGELKVERTPKKGYPGKPDYEHVIVYREFRLYIAGRFVRQMMGAGDYYTNNPETNYADAVEASESYALNRSGKPFGIAAQCWDKGYGEWWKANYAFQSDGKWKKKPAAYTQQKKATKPADTGVSEAPITQPQHIPQQSRTVAPSQPKAPASVSDSTLTSPQVVTIVEVLKTASYGTPAKDTNDVWWVFKNDGALDYGKASMRQGKPIVVDFTVNVSKGKTYRNVTTAEFAMGGDTAQDE